MPIPTIEFQTGTSKVQQNDDGTTTATLLLDLVSRNVGGLRTGLQAAMGK